MAEALRASCKELSGKTEEGQAGPRRASRSPSVPGERGADPASAAGLGRALGPQCPPTPAAMTRSTPDGRHTQEGTAVAAGRTVVCVSDRAHAGPFRWPCTKKQKQT